MRGAPMARVVSLAGSSALSRRHTPHSTSRPAREWRDSRERSRLSMKGDLVTSGGGMTSGLELALWLVEGFAGTTWPTESLAAWSTNAAADSKVAASRGCYASRTRRRREREGRGINHGAKSRRRVWLRAFDEAGPVTVVAGRGLGQHGSGAL